MGVTKIKINNFIPTPRIDAHTLQVGRVIVAWWIFFVLAALAILAFVAKAEAQNTQAPFKTSQANTDFFVNMGAGTYSNIQKTVTAACAYSLNATVVILPGSNPPDTIGAVTGGCTKATVIDRRALPWACYSWSGSTYAATNCVTGGGGGAPPAGNPQDVQTNFNGTSFGADPGNFTYTVVSHQLNTINQTMSGVFSQIAVDKVVPNNSGAGMYVENDSTTAPPSGGFNGAATFETKNWGPGQNISGLWRVAVGIYGKLDAYSSGIAQAMHLDCNHYGSGDSACIYIGNAQGFSPCLWTDGSGEGCVGINVNGIQFDCIANGTITSTTGTGDRNPVFNISPVNCNGAQQLINDGVIIDTSITTLTTSLVGAVSTQWETNTYQIGKLPVTPGTATPSTGMCKLTADLAASTLLDVYQTKAFNCATHDGLPIAVGHVFIANAGTPEQADVITYNAGTGAGTISAAKSHPTGAYLFQGGPQGFGDFGDDMAVLGLHSVVYVLGAPDANNLLVANRQAGGFIGTGLPYVNGEPAGLSLTGTFVVHPGALCIITNSNNSQCGLESNTIPWAAGHSFSSPTGIVTLQDGISVFSTQTSPDNPSSAGYGIGVSFYSETNHSRHPFYMGANLASLSKYKNSGVGSGWLTAPPAITLTGPISNVLQFGMTLKTDGSMPCGGATILCYTNSSASVQDMYLYKNGQGADQIEINQITQQFKFSWGITAQGTSSFIDVNARTLSVQSINPAIPQNNGNFLVNGRNWFGSQTFLNFSSCNVLNCAPTLDGTNAHLSAGALTAGDVFVGARAAVINNLFPFTAGSSTVCYAAAFVTSVGVTNASAPSCLTNSAATPNNFVQAWQGEGAQYINIYRTSGGLTQGLVCANLTPASPTCFDNALVASGSTPTFGQSGTLTVDGPMRAYSASVLPLTTSGDMVKFDNATGHLADSGIPSSTLASTATINNWSAQQNFQSLAVAQTIVNANGLQVVTGSGCTTAASLMAPCNVTMTLATVEPNTAYSVEGCTMNGAAAILGNASSLTTTNFVLAEYSATAAAATGGTVTCLVIHN